jgi:predicted nucleotidyltransferase
VTLRIEVDHQRIAEFCQRNHIVRLSFFGSVLRDDFTQESDVDVLVEYEPGASVGLMEMAGQQQELSDIVCRTVDLKTVGFLSRYFRDEVLAEAQEEYVA